MCYQILAGTVHIHIMVWFVSAPGCIFDFFCHTRLNKLFYIYGSWYPQCKVATVQEISPQKAQIPT